MYIKIVRDGEPRSAHFGVSDIVTKGLSVNLFYFHNSESNECEGFVSAAAAAPTFDKISARETINRHVLDHDIPVVVAQSGHNSQIVTAAQELKDNNRYENAIKLLL